jgi:hypothetical protein
MEQATESPIPLALTEFQRENEGRIAAINERRNALVTRIFKNEGVLDGIKYSAQVNDKNWSIITQPVNEFSTAAPIPPYISVFEISQDLAKAAQKAKPQSTEEKRQKALDFLAANWQQIVKIFYQNPDQIETTANLPCFTEVKLLDNSNISFIGIGPDGKLIVIDIQPNNSNQRKNFNDYLTAINRLIQNLSRPLHISPPEITEDNLVVYSLMPNFTSKENNLLITPINKAE